MEQGNCPICTTKMDRMVRYPRSICGDCCTKENVKDASGNPVWFANSHPFGMGFVSLHTIDGTVVQKEEHVCYVKGVKCYAEEARFGGIVIQAHR